MLHCVTQLRGGVVARPVLLHSDNYVCADCGYEWPQQAAAADGEAETTVRDANGNALADGDAVVLIKDLKVKGSSITLKR